LQTGLLLITGRKKVAAHFLIGHAWQRRDDIFLFASFPGLYLSHFTVA
jgi:hypothetical protein